jgi:hypothetical protein
LPKTETTGRTLLQNGDLMAESQDLNLLNGTGPNVEATRARKAMKNGLIVETMMISRPE